MTDETMPPESEGDDMSIASVLSIRREEAVKMMQEMKFLTADRWDDERLLEKLQQLPGLLEDEPSTLEPKSPECRDLLAAILKAAQDGVELELEQSHHSNGHMPKRKGSSKKKETTMSTAVLEKPTTKGKKGAGKATGQASQASQASQAKEKAKADKFGSREGSKHAAINKALSKKAKSMTELVEEAGMGERSFYNHLNKLVAKDLIEKTGDNKYKLK